MLNPAAISAASISVWVTSSDSMRDDTLTFPLSTLILACACLSVFFSPAATADTVQQYQSQQAFLIEAFQGKPPAPQLIWLNGNLRQDLTNALGHEPDRLRVRYWRKNKRSAWILDEIGKTRPITAGVVIEGDDILYLKVLAFRESRGWEIKHPFFTRQFTHLSLNSDGQLNRSIDGITGATLSVNAMRRVARAALVLNRAIEG